ncbi:MAG: lytic murein transglycosylase [Patescibacteria group bacterium]|nr:lytic murein transglycosylase [Patescibacteria group bacterium]
MSKFFKITLLLVLLSVLVLPNFSAISQEDCQTIQECKALWKELQGKIKKLEGVIGKTEQEKKTLQNQISVLRTKIQQLELRIQQGNIMIKDLSFQIADTETSIEKTSLKIEDLKEKLVGILRTVYEEDQKSLIEILLSEKTLSGFFDNLMTLEILNQKNQELLEEIKGLKSSLERQKEKLDAEKENLAQTVKVQNIQKQESEATRKKLEELRKMTEAQYQQYLKEKQELEKRVGEIMARIAQLSLPGLAVPTDPKELYELAKWAGNAAGGVRPALILGLLEVESALGVNVGQCNCAGQPVCRHPELSYKQVMNSRQWDAFERITKELGLNPNTTPVSCYVDGGKVQMGGAMGPAQFMPTTWLNSGYKQRVENITGVRPANPWRARDAFLAAALYLADWNASTQNQQSEIGAVTAFLCGTSTMTTRCQEANGEWYRNLVMQKANQWQKWVNEGAL